MLPSFTTHLMRVVEEPSTKKKVAGHTDNAKPADSPNCSESYQLGTFTQAREIPDWVHLSAFSRKRHGVSTPQPIYNNVKVLLSAKKCVQVPSSIQTGPIALLLGACMTPTKPDQEAPPYDKQSCNRNRDMPTMRYPLADLAKMPQLEQTTRRQEEIHHVTSSEQGMVIMLSQRVVLSCRRPTNDDGKSHHL